MKINRISLLIFFMSLLAICLTSCGGGGGGGGSSSPSGGGSSSGTPAAALEIYAPASNPPVILAGEQTTVTISTCALGTYVELQVFDGLNYVKLGEMKDDGQNGDQKAGDKVYTIQRPVNESVATKITYRIKAVSNGQEQMREISIPVIHIPTLATNAEFNETTTNLFLKTLETRALLKNLNRNITNTPPETVDQVGDNLLVMFKNFEAVTKQDFGFRLFGLAKEEKSVTQLMDIFSENPLDARVNSIRQGVIDSGCLSEVDLTIVSDLERRLCAKYYLFNGTINPDGEGVQLLKNSQKVLVKEMLSEPTSLVGDGLSSLFGLGTLGKIGVKELLGQGIGIVVDWFLDKNADANILIGQVQDAEEFSVPSAIHNVLYSFGGDKSKGVVKNINVPYGQITTIEFSPGAIIEHDITPPSTPTSVTAAAVSSLQINLAWIASTDNIGVTGYNIYRGGTFLKAVTTTSASDMGLSPSTQYCYSVSAYDAEGNRSPLSQEVCALTSPAGTYSISGRVTLNGAGLAGVTLSLSGTTYSAATGPDGNYIVANVPSGSYTIIPSLTGYTFNPPTIAVTIANGNLAGRDFVAMGESLSRGLFSISAGDSHTVAVKSDGTLWAWGFNFWGELGDGTNIDKYSPVQVGTESNWAGVSAGWGYSLGVKSDGTLWAWGDNKWGALGDGTNTNRNSPIQIGTENNWMTVSAGISHTMAVKSDGTLWAWGNNIFGGFGDGTTTSRNSPIQIGTSQNWSAVLAGDGRTMAVKSDGTLWAWGSGNLGDGTSSSYSYFPVQVGTESNWVAVSAGTGHTMALKSDGTLWGWGNNNASGQLGDGTNIAKYSPIRVGTESNWVAVSAGTGHTMALKSDGTLWAWGHNNYGQLGDGTYVDRNSPVQVGTASDWVAVSAGWGHTIGLKSDGTLWGWGNNDFGRLGDGTNFGYKNSPVQVGTANNWGF